MGLFGFVKKAVGKVAKTGLSVVTKGLSDKVLSALKSTGQAKQAAKQAAAQVATQQRLAMLTKVSPSMAKAPAQKVTLALRPLTGKKAPAKKRKKAAPKAKAVKKTSGAKRTPPKGGLDLAAIARQWKAAGKPGKWIDYIKANPIRKK